MWLHAGVEIFIADLCGGFLPADVSYIHERLRKYVSRAEAYSAAAGTSLQYVLLDMSPVTHLDTTGTYACEGQQLTLMSGPAVWHCAS